MSQITLRRWQAGALQAYQQSGSDFLAVACPGAGKTIFALVCAATTLAQMPDKRMVVVAPTAHLKSQWAESAANVGLVLHDNWNGSEPLPDDCHGVATTYQQVASRPGAFATVAAGGLAMFDEIHHAGVDKAWGDACVTAFKVAAQRLSLSGTPFRSDNNPIPFIRYDRDGLSSSDVTYGYADGLADQVVRPVSFQVVSGDVSWVASDGSRLEASMEDYLPKSQLSQRLRGAIDGQGDWLQTVLQAADGRLTKVRNDGHPDAGGLVLAVDLEHARTIAKHLFQISGEKATLILSDDPQASDRIEQFSRGNSRWLVAVRMVSEGVDVPRLRVGVWATTTSTELFFRQAVGRLVRVGHGPYGESFMFLPRDPRLVQFAAGIHEERNHQLAKPDVPDEDAELARAMAERNTEGAQFEALASSVGRSEFISTSRGAAPAPASDDSDSGGAGAGSATIDLPKVVRPSAAPLPVGMDKPKGRANFQDLRRDNQRAVRKIARLTGMPEAHINAQLNASVGVVSVTEANIPQLVQRVKAARAWARQLS